MDNITRPCIEVTQPIGKFYMTSLDAKVLVNRLRISARKDEPSADGSPNKDVQREPSKTRIRDIATYVKDPDATFPTAIIISADSRYAQVHDDTITFTPALTTDEDPPSYAQLVAGPDFLLGELLDGQHRVKGLREAQSQNISIEDFQLPVVVMLDLELAEKAYVFSIINSKQTPVPKSLIYDLFGLSTERTPYLICHQIARAMNTEKAGPFENGLKMLGKRRQPSEMLTQGSFVKYLLRMITSTPDADAIALKSNEVPKDNNRPFNAFFNNKRDELILKTMQIYFTAIARAFPSDWATASYVDEHGSALPKPTPVLRRTVGYEALMRALELIWPEVKARGDLNQEFFDAKAEEFKRNVGTTALTTEHFGSSSADAGRLASLLIGKSTLVGPLHK